MPSIPLLAAIPAPPGSDLQVGPLTLHAYGLALGLAIVAATTLGERALAWQGIAVDSYWSVIMPSLLMGLVGGRLYHVASEPARYAQSPEDIVKIWHGGLGIYGAVLLGAVTALYLAPRNGIPRGVMLDAGAVGIPLGQAVGRWGNWFNQELFGRPLDAPWALVVEPAARPARFATEDTFHPTFLYESMWTLMLALAMAMLVRRWRPRPSGILFPMYLTGYAIERFLVEFLRVDAAHEWLGLRQNHYVSAAVAALAIAWLAWMVRNSRADRHPAAAEQASAA